MRKKKELPYGCRQRAKNRFEIRWTYNNKRYSVSGRTPEECERKQDEKQALIEKECYITNKDITLKKYFEEYANRHGKSVRESTILSTKVFFDRIITVLGEIKVREIERRTVYYLQDKLCELGYATSTINSTITALYSVMKEAIADRIIEYNPCMGVKHLKRKEPEARETIHRALTREETECFFKEAKAQGSHYYWLYYFLLHTGCRIGEAGALSRADIDFEKEMIHIRHTVTETSSGRVIGDAPKTKSSVRDIPLTPAIKRALMSQEQRNRELYDNVTSISYPNPPIFRTMNKCLIHERGISNDMVRIQKAAGIEHFSLHAFRDTFATRAIESGMTPQTLKEIMGHSSFKMTMDLYAHVMPETKRGEMDQIDTGINS